MLNINVIYQSFYGLLGLVLLIGGISLLVGAMKANKEAQDSLSWPSVTGEVVTSWIKEKGRTSRNRSSYDAIVKYSYTVMQKVYKGERVVFGAKITGPRVWAQEIIDRYPKGNIVTVYYDPQDPTKAVLEHGTGRSGQLILLFSIAGILGGIYLIAATLLKILPIFYAK